MTRFHWALWRFAYIEFAPVAYTINLHDGRYWHPHVYKQIIGNLYWRVK